MAMTPRHLVNFAPSLAYSSRRSRSPSRPSVTCSPSAPASGFAPRSTLMPGMMSWLLSTSTNARPSFALCRSVSSYRMTPLMYSPAPCVLKSSCRHARRLSSVDSTPIEARRRVMVPVLSSAARMPRPGATSARAMPSSVCSRVSTVMVLFRLPRSYGACNICSTRSTASAFPTMSGVRSWTASGCRSRIRSAPLLALPPACSAT